MFSVQLFMNAKQALLHDYYLTGMFSKVATK